MGVGKKGQIAARDATYLSASASIKTYIIIIEMEMERETGAEALSVGTVRPLAMGLSRQMAMRRRCAFKSISVSDDDDD